MAPDPARLLALADAIADGQPVDWEEVSGTASPGDQDLVEHLRLIAGVASIHQAVALPEEDERIGTTWGSLRIIERVGGGSFGVVYRARDERLVRDVALKLLRHDSLEARGSAVIDEGRLLARVRHPNVITVHGADRYDGTIGLWMEFVEGRTLEEILRNDGPFAAREAALIGIDLCSALAAVHAEGLVHGDIKAQNVMREVGGRVVLMDFGAGHDDRRRDSGGTVGTPVYMAPEVLHGDQPTVASDLYGLGVLLFRLATGRYPVEGKTVDALRAAHDSPRRLLLRDARPDLPVGFISVIERALAKDPAQRFSSAGEMQAALADGLVARPRRNVSRRTVAIAVVLFVAVVSVAGTLWFKAASAAPPASAASLGVRPLRNLHPDPAQNYFAAGLTEVLLAHLGSVSALRVRELPAGGVDNQTLQQSGVDRILEGSVHRENGRVRVSARVVQAGSGHVVWGKVFEGSEHEAFSLQSRIARELVRELDVPITDTEAKRIAPRYFVQTAAQDAYLRGKYLLDTHTRETLLQARVEFERAIRLEPEYAPAFAALARTYLALGNAGLLPPDQVRDLAPRAAESAHRIDPMLAEGALALADVRFRLSWDWVGADDAYRQAIALNPSDIQARGQYARYLAAARRLEDAMREAREAYQLDPLSMDIHIVVGMTLYYSRRFEEAIAHFQSRNSEPSSRSHVGIGRAASAAGRHDLAIPALRRAVELSGGDPSIRAELARALAAAGETAASRSILRDLEARRGGSHEYIAPQDLAYVYIALAQPDVAFDLLNRAMEEHASRLLFIGVDPRVDAIRPDARFAHVMEKLRNNRQ